MIRKSFLLALAVAFALPAGGGLRAQTADEAARELLTVMKVEEQYKQMALAMAAQLRPVMQSVATRLPEEKRAQFNEFSARLVDNFAAADPREMLDLTAKVYAKYYTVEELKGLKEFYNTPLGSKMMVTMPNLTAELMGMSMQWSQGQTGQVMQSLMQEFPELGGGAPAPAAGAATGTESGTQPAPADPDHHNHQ